MSKICVYCNQDVSNQPRVKDPAGKYYCEPCYAQHGGKIVETPAAPPPRPATAPAPRPMPASDELMLKEEEPRRVTKAPAPAVIATASASDDDLMLKDEPAPRPARSHANPPAAKAPAPAGGTATAAATDIPDVCPACGLKVVVKRPYCLGCKRDFSQMGTYLKHTQEAKEDTATKVGKSMGKILGVIGGLVILAVIGLMLFRAFYQTGTVFEDYPTSRQKLITDFMGHIAGGNDASFDKAYKLISERETGIQNTWQTNVINNMRSFNADLVRKHGAGWISKMKIVIPPPVKFLGDENFAEIKIDAETYHIGFQAQIGRDVAILERHIANKDKKPHMEDGKTTWGIGECREWPLVDSTHAAPYRPGSDAVDMDEGLPGI